MYMMMMSINRGRRVVGLMSAAAASSSVEGARGYGQGESTTSKETYIPRR